MAKHYSTIDGLKRDARKLSRAKAIPLNQALDVVALDAGYGNFVHASRELGRSEPRTYALVIERRWSDRSIKARGCERLSLSLTQDATKLLPPHVFKGYLGGQRLKDGCLMADERVDTREQARAEACRTARAVQFMMATGLRPSHSYLCYPRGQWHNHPPGLDHGQCWYDPTTRGYVLTDEPYSTSLYEDERRAWAERHSYTIETVRRPSVYGFGTELHLIGPAGGGAPLRRLAARLERAPAAILPEDWERYAVP